MNIENIGLILAIAGAITGVVSIMAEILNRYSQRKSNKNTLTQATLEKSLTEWEKNLNIEVDRVSLSLSERDDIKRQLENIRNAIVNEQGKNPTRLEKLINMLKVMSPDIFDVVLQSLNNPLSAISLTSRKIGDSAKIEKQ